MKYSSAATAARSRRDSAAAPKAIRTITFDRFIGCVGNCSPFIIYDRGADEVPSAGWCVTREAQGSSNGLG